MELLYLYLDDYKNFPKKDFCFSSEFIISITSEKDGKATLHIKSNPSYIPNFFENYNILNVTAIIGQNGTGKSNILEFIRTALPDGMGGFNKECILAFKETGKQIDRADYHIYFTPKLKITLKDETGKFQASKLGKREKKGYLQTNYSIDSLFDTLFINYSNIVDLKIPSTMTRTKIESEDETSSSTGYRNISTMAMIAKDQQDFANDPSSRVEKVDAYKSREFGRNIEFISSQYTNLLDFELPENLFVVLMDEDEKILRGNSKTYDWLFKITDKYENEFKGSKKDPKPFFFVHFLRSVFFNIVRTDLLSSSISFSPDYIKKSKGKTFEEFFRNILSNMKSAKFEGSPASSMKQKSETILQFIDFVYEFLIKTTEPRIIMNEDKMIALPVNFKGQFSIQDFIDRYIRTKTITDFIQFKWRSLSSGEQSLLTLISRFYKLSQELSAENVKQEMIILLDEPDIYFHPEWQRTLLFRLLNYLPQLFPDRKLQLIITANTPYLVSDLPPSNVIMLRIKEGTLKVHTAFSIQKTTFASNIHTLLSEDFYVSNFIGEFAKNKIEKVIQYIENPEQYPYYTPTSALSIIELIGEPVIKNRLTDMLFDKFPILKNTLQIRRDQLVKELDEVDKLIGEEDNDD